MAGNYFEFQTTNEHTFTAPQRLPGYTGYIPQMKYGYGDSFGSATAAQLHDYRQKHLSGWRGGDHHMAPFPLIYNDPSHISSTRDRSRARWLTPATVYDLSVSNQQQADVLKFDRLCQEHREYYRDRSQTVKPVPYFQRPTPLGDIEAENIKRKWKPLATKMFSSGNTDGRLGSTDVPPLRTAFSDGSVSDRSIAYSNRLSAGGSGRRPTSAMRMFPSSSSRPVSTRRERMMRDSVFENRVGYE